MCRKRLYSPRCGSELKLTLRGLSSSLDKKMHKKKVSSKNNKKSVKIKKLLLGRKICCRPFRSGYRTVIKDRFLPPPIPAIQTTTGRKWANNDVGGASYLTLNQNIAMKDALKSDSARKKYPNEMPYDFSNPVVDSETMKKRMCQ